MFQDFFVNKSIKNLLLMGLFLVLFILCVGGCIMESQSSLLVR